MARLYLRGRVYWCWGYDVDGKRWSESTHQRDRRAAELAAREIERRYAASPDHAKRSKLTLEKALLTVLAFQEQANRAPATIRATEYHARHLVTVLDRSMRLDEVTLEHTTSYLAARLDQGADRHTVAKELRTLTQAMRRCAKLGTFVGRVDPSHLIPDELGKVYTPRKRWLTRDEYAALLRALDPQRTPHARTQDRRDYLTVWCETGMRESELYALKPEHYRREQHAIEVPGTKTELALRLVPLSPAAEAIVKRRLSEDGPGFPRWFTVRRDLARACKAAGIAPVTPNDLRRTFASWLVNAGVPERVIADLLGHEDTTMVRAVYGHVSRDSMASAIAAMGVAAGVAAQGKKTRSKTKTGVAENLKKPHKKLENKGAPSKT